MWNSFNSKYLINSWYQCSKCSKISRLSCNDYIRQSYCSKNITRTSIIVSIDLFLHCTFGGPAGPTGMNKAKEISLPWPVRGLRCAWTRIPSRVLPDQVGFSTMKEGNEDEREGERSRVGQVRQGDTRLVRASERAPLTSKKHEWTPERRRVLSCLLVSLLLFAWPPLSLRLAFRLRGSFFLHLLLHFSSSFVLSPSLVCSPLFFFTAFTSERGLLLFPLLVFLVSDEASRSRTQEIGFAVPVTGHRAQSASRAGSEVCFFLSPCVLLARVIFLAESLESLPAWFFGDRTW